MSTPTPVTAAPAVVQAPPQIREQPAPVAAGGAGLGAHVELRGIAASGGDRTTREVGAVLGGRVEAFGACYREALHRDPVLAGSVATAFHVTPDGAIDAPAIEHPNAVFARCGNRVLAETRFPRAVEETFVNVTIVLVPGG